MPDQSVDDKHDLLRGWEAIAEAIYGNSDSRSVRRLYTDQDKLPVFQLVKGGSLYAFRSRLQPALPNAVGRERAPDRRSVGRERAPDRRSGRAQNALGAGARLAATGPPRVGEATIRLIGRRQVREQAKRD